jgi:hypothetical protein
MSTFIAGIVIGLLIAFLIPYFKKFKSQPNEKPINILETPDFVETTKPPVVQPNIDKKNAALLEIAFYPPNKDLATANRMMSIWAYKALGGILDDKNNRINSRAELRQHNFMPR